MVSAKKFIISLSLVAGFFNTASAQNDLVINEIQVGNIDTYIDPSYNYGGWIELYNPSTAAINLSGMYVSDDPDNLKKYRLTASHGSIAASGYKVLYFDHNSADGTYGTGATAQIRFKLDADGGTIYFSDSNGNLLFSQDYPESISRCSFARTSDNGATWRWTGSPTPGSTNNGSVFADEQLAAPVINVNSGILTETTNVTAEIPTGVTIRYTVDGSTPTASVGSTLDGNGINVSATKVIRFRAYKAGYLPSAVVTRSYIFRDKNYTLPIVSVVTNSKNLYDNTIGVYTTGTNGVTGRGINYKSNKNMDWERPVNFEYINADGECMLNQEVTFAINGGWSRHWEPTSFKLKTEKVYDGENYYPCTMFEEKPYNKNRCVIMRNGGNDTGCRTKDATIQRVVQTSGLYLDGQSFNPCHVFINGSYHAMLNMREPSNKYFAYANYGYDTDEIDQFELSPDDGGQVLKEGTTTAWTTLLSQANKASDATTYENIVQNYLDIDEYINYMAAECWLGCSDWLTNNNNVKWFRNINNGRFHFVMFDTDSAFDNSSMLTSLKNSSGNNVTILFNRMAKNADFKKQFMTAFCLVDGSVFTSERAIEAAQYVGNLTDAPLALDGKDPWSSCNSVSSTMGSSSAHTSRINALKSYFSQSSSMSVKLNANISEAQLMVNGQPVPTNKFNGTLFAPVTLTASAPAGYNFVGWRKSNSSTSNLMTKASNWYYYDKGSLDNTDWKTGDVSNWGFAQAPLGYAKDGLKTTISYGSDSNNKYLTYYFRRNVGLSSEPTNDNVITLNYTVDDGCIVYVNGVEAGRHNMPAGNVTFNTAATTYCSGNPDSGSMVLDNSLFHQGQNIIAVEVHNNAGTSSDIYWDAEVVLEKSDGEVSFTDREITIDQNQTTSLTAVFEPLPDECLVAAGSTPVVVNEVSASNGIYMNEYYKRNDWVELYNTTSNDIDLSGMYISDDESDPHKYQISSLGEQEGTVIPAHGYKIIWADKLDPLHQLHAGFKLANADEQCVIITATDDSWSNKLTYNTHKFDETVGRYPDGGKRVYRLSRPTIAKANQLTYYSELIAGEDTNFDVESYIAGIERPEYNIENTPQYGVYDLQGRKLGDTFEEVKYDLAPGIYIVNGKKTIIK